jgi:hypothetical protein
VTLLGCASGIESFTLLLRRDWMAGTTSTRRAGSGPAEGPRARDRDGGCGGTVQVPMLVCLSVCVEVQEEEKEEEEE